jgi:hypothetical protein
MDVVPFERSREDRDLIEQAGRGVQNDRGLAPDGTKTATLAPRSVRVESVETHTYSRTLRQVGERGER